MKKCINCGNELTGIKRKFCCRQCNENYHNHLYRGVENTEHRLKKHKIWRDSHKKEISENKARYYQNNKEELKAIRRQFHKDHPEVDKKYKQTPKGRLISYRHGAKQRNLPFTLELDYFELNWDKSCAYCGDTIKGIGIDRTDNNRGYTYDNVVLCCEMCNKMKLNHRKEVFIEHCRKISNFN